MLLSFEKSQQGHSTNFLPQAPDNWQETPLPEKLLRKVKPRLPQLSETELSRHYSELEEQTFGINKGFYPLGSCTMKYNPKVNNKVAGNPAFAQLHPTQREEDVQGALAAYELLDLYLREITGMDKFSFAPMAGAQGEFTSLLAFRAYHKSKGQDHRDEILIPDSAHGTNPASATMAGYKTVHVMTDDNGCIDLDSLKEKLSDNTAGLMLTNPNTLGIFDTNISEITHLVHQAGGLNFYDGANLNAVLGLSRPGDMGFDMVHLNLHKSFSTPHGGGGPGSGPVGCKDFLRPFLPENITSAGEDDHIDPADLIQEVYDDKLSPISWTNPDHSLGRVGAFNGNYLVSLRALAYVLRLGKEGIPDVARHAVLNANYMQSSLYDILPPAFDRICMHEFVVSCSKLKKETGCTAKDFAKRLQDYGMHPPTMYFPLNVEEALMIEPTETEGKDRLDDAIAAFREVYETAYSDPDVLLNAPHKQKITRPDEATAARHPIVKYDFAEDTK